MPAPSADKPPKPSPGKSGDSSVQRAAEGWVIDSYNRTVEPDRRIKPTGPIQLSGSASVSLDGISEDGTEAVEIYVRQKALKAGHRRKVAMDALKLISLRQSNAKFKRLILIVADEEVHAALTNERTWLAHALAAGCIDVVMVDLDPAERTEIREAQERQYR